MFIINWSVCPKQAFLARARALTSLERLAMDKHSNLLQSILNNSCKKSDEIDTRLTEMLSG